MVAFGVSRRDKYLHLQPYSSWFGGSWGERIFTSPAVPWTLTACVRHERRTEIRSSRAHPHAPLGAGAGRWAA